MKMKDKITDKIMSKEMKRTAEDGWEDNSKSVKFDLNRNQIYEIAKRSSIIFEDADNTDDDFEFYEMCFRNNNNGETNLETQKRYGMEKIDEIHGFDGINYDSLSNAKVLLNTGSGICSVSSKMETVINETTNKRTEASNNCENTGIEIVENLNNNVADNSIHMLNGLYEGYVSNDISFDNNVINEGFRTTCLNNSLKDLNIVIETKEIPYLNEQTNVAKDNKWNTIENESGVVEYSYPKIKENPFIKNDKEKQKEL